MYRLYNHNIWNYNPPEDRNLLIHSLIEEFDADFCTFQECSHTSNRLGKLPIQDLLKDKYTEVGIGLLNYTPVFFKTEKFNLIDSGYMLYDGLNDANSKSVTWALVEDKTNGKKFVVMSTHFWWRACGEEDILQRVENARQLKALCSDLIEKYNIPIIIGGDFNNGLNSTQGDLPYHFMIENGFKDVRLTSPKSTDCHTCRAQYKLSEGEKAYVEAGDPDITIDYIFTYGEGITPVSFDIDCGEKARLSSDHLPLLSYFEA